MKTLKELSTFIFRRAGHTGDKGGLMFSVADYIAMRNAQKAEQEMFAENEKTAFKADTNRFFYNH